MPVRDVPPSNGSERACVRVITCVIPVGDKWVENVSEKAENGSSWTGVARK